MQTDKSQLERTEFLDRNYTTIAKGIAIILIMLSHCSGHWTFGRLLTPCGGIGVAIFLIVSGFGLNESYKRNGLISFWTKRLGRVYIPYFIVMAFFAIVKQWDFKTCILKFLCIQSPYWFITYIVGCYVVFWISIKLTSRYYYIFILLFSVLSLFILPEMQAEQSFCFFIGIIMSLYKNSLFSFRDKQGYFNLTFVCLAIVGLSFLALKQLPCVRNDTYQFEINIVQLFIKCPLGLFILFVIDKQKYILRNPFVRWTGRISYELYLVHFPFYVFIQSKFLPALLLIAISYIAAYLFWHLNNRVQKYIL